MAKQTAEQIMAAHVARINASIKGENNFLREGQKYFTADDAKEAAQQAPNVQTEGQAALKEGDVFTVPATPEEFDAVFFGQTFSVGQRIPSFFLALPVKRGEDIVPINVFSTAFTRGIRKAYAVMNSDNTPKIDEDGKPVYKIDENQSYPGGKPAEDVRNTPGSLYDALASLMGKTIVVKKRERVDCWRLKSGAKRNSDNGFDDDQFEVGKQAVLTFAYVEDKKQNDKKSEE